MDFGGPFEAVFWRIRRFILVVWAKNAPKNGPNEPKGAANSMYYTLPGIAEHRAKKNIDWKCG